VKPSIGRLEGSTRQRHSAGQGQREPRFPSARRLQLILDFSDPLC